MINPLSIVTGLAMAVIIGHTFEVKRHVGALDRELRDIRRTTEEVETRTQTLAAEWARLNDQDRLRGLADRHLGQMVPMQPMQFVRHDEGVRRLPGALAWAGEVSPFAPRREPVAVAEAAGAVQTAGTSPGPGVVANATPPAPRPATAVATASPASAAPAIEPNRAPTRPIQLAEANAARPAAIASPRAVPVVPEAAARPVVPASSLPSVAAPPAGLARAVAPQPIVNPTLPAAPAQVAAPRLAPTPPPRAPALAAVAAPPRPADNAALPPVRSTMLVQRVDTGSMLGGQAVALAPPVPWGR